jgi:hypothetical protein
MSYICLMVNDAGAVAAADSRESFYRLHMDWRQKVFSLPERKLIWCCCGPTFRHGVDIFRLSALILRRNHGTLEQQLERMGKLVAVTTKLRLPKEDPGVFVFLGAQWEDGGFSVYNYWVREGQPHLDKRRVAAGQAVSLHAGAWYRELPPLSAEALKTMDYDQMVELAKERIALAIRKDEERREKNRRHNQTIGGRVRTCGIRVNKSPLQPAQKMPDV